MSLQASLVYSFTTVAKTAAQAAADIAAIPLDLSVLQFLGLRVSSDTNAAGPPTTRTIVVKFDGDADQLAGATAVIEAGESGSRVTGVTVTSSGTQYARPPVVSFSGGVAAGGVLLRPARAHALMMMAGARVIAGGANYTAPTLAIVGGGGQGATGTVTVVANAVTGIVITNPGSGYVDVPQFIITDSIGSSGGGAIVQPLMGVDTIVVDDGGSGYGSAPIVNFKSYYNQIFGSNQSAPLPGLFTKLFEQGLRAKVVASAPALS